MDCEEPTRRFPSAGDSQWRSSSQQRTSATGGSTLHSASGRANSTKRKAPRATKVTYAGMTRNTKPPGINDIGCYATSTAEARHNMGPTQHHQVYASQGVLGGSDQL